MQEYFELLMEEKLSLLLILLKIFPNLQGYDFLKEGAKKIVNDREKKINVGVGLYQEIADEHDIKHDGVDRAMRHCIDVSFKRNGFLDFEKAFCMRFTSVKPRPKELLCVLAEKAYIEVSKEMSKLNFT